MRLIKSVLMLGLVVWMFGAVYAQKSDLRVYTLTVHSQRSPLGGNMVDLDKRHAYPLDEAGYNPKRIDFGYMYGSNTGGNLMVPVSQGFLTFGNPFKDALLSWGNNRNNGYFINMGNDQKAQEIFNTLQSADSLAILYERWFDKIMEVPNYEPSKHGPGQRVRNMTIGDVLLFRSENKDTYHIFRITKLVLSNNGLIELEVKSPKNVKKKRK
ncbi:hypothetical protein G5B00_01630 [Parapedobacter sp. SGR-10]|uniref:hypothetical protein n=1 Tax=Parapedobacter sp. SGR-10 TaxID=2710879 RepID=UPI0013D5F4E4|nr:hypothetical protein [Parapedobacter sp. SGR-10]NGF55200.1 hypothetical protein [Parapedobacter sp. SGR-10]